MIEHIATLSYKGKKSYTVKWQFFQEIVALNVQWHPRRPPHKIGRALAEGYNRENERFLAEVARGTGRTFTCFDDETCIMTTASPDGTITHSKPDDALIARIIESAVRD